MPHTDQSLQGSTTLEQEKETGALSYQNGSRKVKQSDFGIGPTWVSLVALPPSTYMVSKPYPPHLHNGDTNNIHL